MDTYILDLETTFSTENTLTTKGIEEYVRSPKFEVIGLGVKRLDGAPLDELGRISEFVPGNIVPAFLEDISRWNSHEGVAFIAHHAQFDGFILNHVYGFKPAFWYDTLSMSRALYQRLPSHSLDKLVAHFGLGTPKTVPYNQFRGKTLAEIEGTPLMKSIGVGCLHDIELTHALFTLMLPQMPEDELELIDETIRLYTEPVLVGDVPLLTEALTEAIVARESKMYAMGLTDDVLKSDKKFATLLRGCGIEPPTKISERTGREAFAFAKSDLEFQALQEHPNERVRDLVEARFAAKTSIHETRAGRILSTAERGTIPVYLKYYGAHTGRFSGGDKSNLQNLPRGSKLRSGLLAPQGSCLVWGDLSQIECRLTAWLAGCETLLDAFREGRDIYSEFAAKAFKCEVSKIIRPDLRFLGKTTILGAGYGLGKEKFAYYLKAQGHDIDRLTSDMLIDAFRKEYREIPRLWRTLDESIKWMDALDITETSIGPCTLIGRRIIGPNGMFLDYEGKDLDKIWGGALTENIVQFLARIILTDAWLKIRREFRKLEGCRVVMSTHDELVCMVPLDCADEIKCFLKEAMIEGSAWSEGLPLDCEIGSGERYGKG